MKSLTDAEIAELHRFCAEELSATDKRVWVEYVPPHLTVHFKKGGQSGLADAGHNLLLSQYATLEKLKDAVKRYAGV
jgi:hypothetical protein